MVQSHRYTDNKNIRLIKKMQEIEKEKKTRLSGEQRKILATCIVEVDIISQRRVNINSQE